MSAVTRAALVGLLVLALGACAAQYRNHGYAPSDADLQTIIVGESTRAMVGEQVGRPASSGVLSTSGWYYVKSRYKQFAYRAPEEIERQVVAISFTEEGVVENVERFTLQDGKVVPLSRRVTENNIKGISVIQQLLGSFGRVSAEQLTR